MSEPFFLDVNNVVDVNNNLNFVHNCGGRNVCKCDLHCKKNIFKICYHNTFSFVKSTL